MRGQGGHISVLLIVVFGMLWAITNKAAGSAALFSQLLGTWDATRTVTYNNRSSTITGVYTVEPLGYGGVFLLGVVDIPGEARYSVKEFLYSGGEYQFVEEQGGVAVSYGTGRWTSSSTRIIYSFSAEDYYGTYTGSATITALDFNNVSLLTTTSTGTVAWGTAVKRAGSATTSCGGTMAMARCTCGR
jgi:hypothetical protein